MPRLQKIVIGFSVQTEGPKVDISNEKGTSSILEETNLVTSFLPVGTPLSSNAETRQPRRENPPTGLLSS